MEKLYGSKRDSEALFIYGSVLRWSYFAKKKRFLFLHLPCLFGFYFYFIYANLYLDTILVKYLPL